AGGCARDPGPTSAESLANSTYLTEVTPDGVVTLLGGAVDFPAGGTVQRIEMYDFGVGDLDYDDETDAVVVLVEFRNMQRLLRLHALLGEDDEVRDVASRLIGDNIRVLDIRVDDGVIEVDMLIRAPHESFQREPTIPITGRFALTDRGLIPVNVPSLREASRMTLGAGAEATLTSHEWILTTIEMGDWSQTTDALDRRPSLRVALELGDAAAGSGSLAGYAGCNQMFGTYTSGEDGTLQIGPLATTRRICGEGLDELETRVMASLAVARSVDIVGDQLFMTFDGGVMRFTTGAEIEPPAPPGSTPPPVAPAVDANETDRET
ncbi:MAG: META domain-containing protein, partial [Gemmatimonadota bacterium]|nr:META domain-containing protein [Gemmatimonadota bacterium]